MTITLFVTGTDTGVGKTRVAGALIAALRARGLRAVGFKPVASGARRTADGLRNADALALARAAKVELAYSRVNPYCFVPPIAPHLAAARARRTVRSEALDRAHDWLAARFDAVVVEGAGGWLVPLNRHETFADWVQRRGFPVLLVVGMRLGCINHALLSARAIGDALVGWVANTLPPAMPALAGNLETLRTRMPVPRWASLPVGVRRAAAARLLAPAVARFTASSPRT